MQHQVDPGPRLAVLARRHLLHLLQFLQPGQVDAHRAGRAVPQVLHVFGIDGGLGRRDLEILGQTLVEPQGHVLEHAVEQRVRQLVAQVLFDPFAVAPEGVDHQLLAADGPRLGDEEGPPLGQVRVLGRHEALVALLVLEQANLDQLRGRRQLERLVDPFAQLGQFLEQG